MNKFDELKEKANDAFKRGDQAEAVKYYSECLELDPDYKSYNSIIYANRAAGNSPLVVIIKHFCFRSLYETEKAQRGSRRC